MDKALSYATAHADAFVDQLIDLLRIPSISTDPAYAEDVQRCAAWLADHLKQIGITEAEVVQTEGHPIVYAEYIHNPALPTVLIYGHYDVQPPDPLELWESPPFEPVLKEGDLYARGSSDDKGQVFMHAKALESYLQSDTPLPVNVKLVIEGEEESGSEQLPHFIAANKEKLAADIVVISDTGMFAPGVPSITYGLRGMSYVEVTLVGPDRDLHSGMYGGGIENPVNALARLISNLHDANHRVTIPGFYDNVVPPTDEERSTFAALPFDAKAWSGKVGVDATKTEAGYTTLEGISARPTLDVNGIWGGYIGEGAKTVLPSKASAKISMRLVANQEPEEISEKIKAYFEANTPPTMKLHFTYLHGGHGVLVDTQSPAMEAAAEALEGVYGRQPYFTRGGGSIPIVAEFKKLLGLDSVLLGFGLDSDAIHSPNEHFGLNRFHEGIEAIVRFFDAYSRR